MCGGVLVLEGEREVRALGGFVKSESGRDGRGKGLETGDSVQP